MLLAVAVDDKEALQKRCCIDLAVVIVVIVVLLPLLLAAPRPLPRVSSGVAVSVCGHLLPSTGPGSQSR